MVVREPDTRTSLRRTIGPRQLVFYGTGTILGAGIYALVGKVAGVAGQLAPLSFMIAALIAGINAYAYARLAARYPRSGGEAEYIYQGFGRQWFSNLIGWLVVFTGVVSAATLATGFVGYFQVFYPLPDWLVTSGLLAVLMTIAIAGVRESAWFVVVVTLIEISGLLIVCGAGFDGLKEKDFMLPEMTQAARALPIAGVLGGAFLSFYAYIGIEDIVNLAEEVKAPGHSVPIAIYASLGIAALLYLAVSLVAIASVDAEQLGRSDAPLADVYARHGGDVRLMTAISLAAIVNGVLAQIVMASRLLYGMRHSLEALAVFSRVSRHTKTPILATGFVGAAALILTLLFPIESLATATSFIVLCVFSLVSATLILLEWRAARPRAVTIAVPAAALILNVGFLVF